MIGDLLKNINLYSLLNKFSFYYNINYKIKINTLTFYNESFLILETSILNFSSLIHNLVIHIHLI